MLLYRWQRSAVFAAFVACGCGGSVEASDEHAATKAQALIATIPGRIEAESYERSLDSTPDVNFGAYVTECDRKDGVDIDRSDDPNDGGCVIGWTTAGEWLEYDIQAPSAQIVDITARVASNLLDRQFHISIDGNSLAEQTLSADSDWTYTNVTYSGVSLSAGAHVLRFTFDSDSINLNYVDVTASATSAPAGPLVETLLPPTNVVASSQESAAFPPSLAIDGDSSTRWSSQFSDPQWIYEDLGETKQVSRVILNWEVAASQSYEIDVSDSTDGPWKVVYSTSAGDGGLDDISFPPVAARYVRMYSTARTTYFGVSLYDFDVFGVVAPDPSCTPVISDAPDDGANVPTGNPGQVQVYPFTNVNPYYAAAFVAPGGSGCGGQCLNGAVLDDGTLVARSAPVWTPDGTIHVFTKDANGIWGLQAVVTDPALIPGMYDYSFAQALGVKGDDLFVSGVANGTSNLYVFVRSGSAWQLKQTLRGAGGFSLVLGQGIALVATGHDARVYQRGSNGLYRLQTIFDAPSGSASNGFGSAIALDNNVAAIGAAATNYTGTDTSAAYVYERCSTLWSFAQALTAPDGAVGVSFGASVAVSGTQIAIGEPYAVGPDPQRAGAVQTFQLQGSQWLPDQRILNQVLPDGQYIRIASSIALHNHLLLIGADEPYPFAFGGYGTLYDLEGTPRFLAAVGGGNTLNVQLSGHEALYDAYARRSGTDPQVYELPQ